MASGARAARRRILGIIAMETLMSWHWQDHASFRTLMMFKKVTTTRRRFFCVNGRVCVVPIMSTKVCLMVHYVMRSSVNHPVTCIPLPGVNFGHVLHYIIHIHGFSGIHNVYLIHSVVVIVVIPNFIDV